MNGRMKSRGKVGDANQTDPRNEAETSITHFLHSSKGNTVSFAVVPNKSLIAVRKCRLGFVSSSDGRSAAVNHR